MKKIFAVLISAVMLFALCSCGGVSLEDTGWSLDYMEVNGLRLDSDFLEEMGAECSISFDKEQATYVSPAGTETYTYSLEDDTVVMTAADGTQLSAAIEDGSLIIDMGEDGVYKFIKD